MFQRAAAAAPLSMRSSVQHHARPFNNNKQRHQRAPASISMTRRRHHVVSASFSVSDITGPVNDTVNDLKSTEVRNFPQLYSSSSFCRRRRENYTIKMMSKRDLHFVARKTTFFFFFNSSRTKRPPPPQPRARAFERRRKKGEEKKKKKKKTQRFGRI